MKTSHDQKCADHVETDEIYERRGQWQDHSAIAELRAALHHLREPHDWSLGGMKRHEDRADYYSERRSQRRPAQRQAHRRPDESERDTHELEIYSEPERTLIAHLPVPFRAGNVVDRVSLNPVGRLIFRRAIG